ncbi:gamma-secretase-activating protein-like isoform X2 [Antedon mediterranea]|uniref:gamma-secretase-activating protein-like isoform X2 n=1 Tax=Antedon mediterranea TaxID=105859 RepID=UPI003AF9E81D
MLKFTCCFDVERDILNYVKKQRREHHANHCFPENKICVKVVGQERGMEVIYVWDDVSHLSSDNCLVTHVGIYTPSNQTHSTLFVHDKQLNIVSCSVNKGHSVLAFVAMVKSTNSKRSPPVGKSSFKSERYSAYLAEIKPQNRIFDLNISRRNQLQVQFLWSNSPFMKESKLILFLHQESIALYNIPLGRVDQMGVVISSQPTISEIVKHFYWSQWDLSCQRLFFVCRKYSKSAEVQPYLVLKCYEYHDKNNNFTKMFEIKLDLPIPAECSQQEYTFSGPSRTVSDKQFNMEVIHQSGGSLCVCYQHPIEKARSESSADEQHVMSSTEDDTDNDDWRTQGLTTSNEKTVGRQLVDMKYTILVVHHGLTINATIPDISRSIAENAQLYFSSLDGYILVYSPGQLSHLVNVSPEINPCLHIALHGNKVSNHPIADGLTDSHNLTHFVRERTASLNGKAFKVSICKDGLVQTFKENSRLSQRLAILHYLNLHMKDPALTKRVMKLVCDDISSQYIPQLFSEYLIGSTFNAVRRSMNKDALKHLPFTSTEALRGQIEHNNGKRITVRFSYTKAPAVFDAFFYKADRKERRQSQVGVNIGVWESIQQLVQALHKGRQKKQRFNTSSLKADLMHDDVTTSTEHERSNSFTDTSSRTGASFMRSAKLKMMSAKKVLAPTLNTTSTSVFYASELHVDKDSNRLQQMMIDKLTRHFDLHLSDYSKKVRMRSLSAEYIECQMKQAKQLLEIVSNSVGGKGQQLEPANIPFQDPVSEKDKHLYNLLERCYLATDSICFPFPPGFQTCFTCLGYRCLSYSSFLQYVERGVLQLTPEFVRKFFAELPDDEEHSLQKHEILIQLPQTEALEIIEEWKHPLALKYLAQQYVEDALKDDCCLEYPFYLNRETAMEQDPDRGSTLYAGSDENESITGAFPPLGTLMKLLREKDPKMMIVNHGFDNEPSCFQMEPRKVEKVALLNTMEKYGNNLSDVTF